MWSCRGKSKLSFTEILPPDFIGQDTKDQINVLSSRAQASLSHETNEIHAEVSYTFLCEDINRWQTHKGSAVVNIIQGSPNTLHQPLFCLFNYVHDNGQNACLEKANISRLAFVSPFPPDQ